MFAGILALLKAVFRTNFACPQTSKAVPENEYLTNNGIPIIKV